MSLESYFKNKPVSNKTSVDYITPEMIAQREAVEAEKAAYQAMINSVQSITHEEWVEIERWGTSQTYGEIRALVYLFQGNVWKNQINLEDLKIRAVADGLVTTNPYRLTEKGVKYAKKFAGILN